MTVQIRFDAKHCAGHALCAAAAPDVFELDDAGYCIPPDPQVPLDLVEQAQRGADACPERAIAMITVEASAEG